MGSTGTDCDPERLARLLADSLGEADLAEATGHLDRCGPCREALEGLAAEDRWWDSLHSAFQPGDHGSELVETPPWLGFLAPSDDPEMLGRLGAYEITGIIGRGGMGLVLKGFDPALDRFVAIKALDPSRAVDPASRRRFARQGIDRWLFQTKPNGTRGGWEGGTIGVQATIPKGPSNNQPNQLLGQFRIEGDFEILAEYAIDSLPRATRDRAGKDTMEPSNNVELGLFGPGWMVTSFRSNSEAKGDQVGFYAKTPTGDSKLVSFVEPPGGHAMGLLGFRRVGDMLTVLHGQSGGTGGILGESGSVRFGADPIPELALQLIKLNSREAMGATFTRL